MPPLVSQRMTTSAPASQAARTTAFAYSGFAWRWLHEDVGVDDGGLGAGGDRVADHLQVFVEGGAQCEFDVAVVGLGDQGDHLGAGVEKGLDLRVLARLAAGAAGGAERDQLGVLEVDLLLGAGEELGVARVGAGPAALDEARAEVVQVPCDGQLVRHGGGCAAALTLRAVAQGRVEDVERIVDSLVSVMVFGS